MKRLKRDRRGVSNIIVVVLGLVIVIAIVSNVILWSYEMNQHDWEKLKEDITILDVSPVIAESWAYNPAGSVLGGGTSWVSGTVSDLILADSNYMTFRSYYSGTDLIDFVDLNTSDVDASPNKGIQSNFTAQQQGPDAIFDTLTEKNTGGAYTELWSDTFKPTAPATWETVSLASYTVPARSVAIIQIYQDESANVKRDAGVRAVGSALNRSIPLHEAEGGGLVLVSMMVQVDENQDIEIYAETVATNTVSFRVIGYFTEVTYTERFEDWNPDYASVWTDKDLYTDYGVPLGSVAEIFVANAHASAQRNVGVRTDGSTLNRYILIHESEGGGQDGFTMCVKTDATTGNIECYNTGTTGHFYLLGFFDSNMGYVERMNSLAAATPDVWEPEILATPENAVVEVLVENDAGGSERYAGVRANASSLDRRVILHEAEGGGLSGGRWSAQSDGARTIELYEDRTQDIQFNLIGYWVIDNYELDVEVQWTTIDYNETNEFVCIKTGSTGAEDVGVDVWFAGTWQTILPNLNPNEWNNVSVSSYLTSSTFTIRFHGGNETSDITGDSWDIDAVVLHVWSNEFRTEVEFHGSSDSEKWSQLNWTVTSAWTNSSVNVILQLYNYTLGDYPTSGNGYLTYVSSATPNTDQTQRQSITVNPIHFRNATGHWKLKITGVKQDANFDCKTDWIEFRGAEEGIHFTFKNLSAATAHLVSLWVNNVTHHDRYDLSIFLNAGASKSYIRSDIGFPEKPYVVKVITEKGNMAIFAES